MLTIHKGDRTAQCDLSQLKQMQEVGWSLHKSTEKASPSGGTADVGKSAESVLLKKESAQVNTPSATRPGPSSVDKRSPKSPARTR